MSGENIPGGEDTPTLAQTVRRWGRNTCAIAAVSVAGGFVGSNLWPAHLEIGPHDATVAPTLSDMAVLDADPLGLLRAPTPKETPPVIGATVNLGRIASSEEESQTETSATPLPSELGNQLNLGEISGFANSYAAAGTDIEDIPGILARQLLTFGSLSGGGALGLAVWLGKNNRHAVAENFKNPKKLAALVAVGSLLTLQQCVLSPEDETVWVPANIETELIQSPLIDELEVSGEYIELSLAGIKEVIGYYEETIGFYDEATRTFIEASPNQPLLRAREDYVTAGFFTDRHCNVGVSKFIAAVADISQAEFLIETGDSSNSGTGAEGFCIRNLVDTLEGDPDFVAVGGNHDSRNFTRSQLEDSGVRVLGYGESTEVEGLKIVGADDPRTSMIGQPTEFYPGESIATAASITRRTACQQDADIVLAHDARVAELALRRGCAPLSLSGHIHRAQMRKVESLTGTNLQIIGDNISGAREDGFTFSKPAENVTMMLLQFNQTTGDLAFYQNVTIVPSGGVQIGEIISIDS